MAACEKFAAYRKIVVPLLIATQMAVLCFVYLPILGLRRDLYLPHDEEAALPYRYYNNTNNSNNIVVPTTDAPPIIAPLCPPRASDKAAICAVARNEEAYIDEWVDYYFAIGFDIAYIVDNADGRKAALRPWYDDKVAHNGTQNKQLIHIPGAKRPRQREAYQMCAKELVKLPVPPKWVAFFDIDEYLVLKNKKHTCVTDMLQEHLKAGALSINWRFFGSSGHPVYQPLPVTKRFQYRFEDDFSNQEYPVSTVGLLRPNDLVKSIVHLPDLDLSKKMFRHPHVAFLKGNHTHRNTAGQVVKKYTNHHRNVDVAVLHHYASKSLAEFRFRKENNKYFGKTQKEFLHRTQAADFEFPSGHVHDDSAWQTLKKYLPKYAVFDELVR
jgi:Glycosyl transferase family 2